MASRHQEELPVAVFQITMKIGVT